jgi:twitching motility protein PilT
MPALTDQDLNQILVWIISEKAVKENLASLRDYDSSFEIKNFCRFRVNAFKKLGHLSIVMRLIPVKIPSFENLGLPAILSKLALSERGLCLVTGATGSGKSSTLAAMIDHINSTKPVHVLTIEDPVEFVHESKKAKISQREVGKDTDSFVDGLRAALRQDPDVILIGEMRDATTFDIALKAAETGHMVFSTVHTTDAAKTIGRLIAMFPPEEQRIARTRLADALVATVSQRLLKRADGQGLIPALEIMVNNTGIAECIANSELAGQMNDYIVKSYGVTGGQTFEQCLTDMYRKKMITLEEAMLASSNAADFERNLKFGHSGKTDQKDENTKTDEFADDEKLDLDL